MDKNLNKKDPIINSKNTTPSKNYSSNNKFDFLKGGNFNNLSKLNLNTNNSNIEKSLNKSRDKDSHLGDNYITINKNYNPMFENKKENFHQTSNNLNNNGIDDNLNSLKLTNTNKFHSEENFIFEKNDKYLDKSYDRKLEFNYDYNKEVNKRNYRTDNNEESFTKFNAISELNNKNFDKKNSYRENNQDNIYQNFGKRDNYSRTDNTELDDKYTPIYIKNFEDNKPYKQKNNDLEYKEKPRESFKNNCDFSDREQNKKEIKEKEKFKNKHDKDINSIENKEKDRSCILKNYDNISEDSKYRENRDDSHNRNSNYNKYSKYDKYENFDREKNEAFGKETRGFDSSRNSRREDENNIEPEKYKFMSLEKKNETSQNENLQEENRRLLNLNTSLTLKNKNFENDLNNYLDKYKKLEYEVESSNEKLGEMENHYLSMLKEKDETISTLNCKITQLEKKDVKNINIRIALFKNLKLFFLNNLKFLKMAEEIKKEYNL